MGFQQANERFADAISEKHVGQFLGMGVAQARARFAQAADFFQRAGDASGIARELNGRGVGQKFALAADGGLDEPPKKNADVADDQQQQTEQRQRILPAPASAAARRLQQNPADDGEAKNAEDDSHEPEVQPHVAVQNMAELVADDALQFVARKQFHAAAGDGDGRVAGFVAGGEGVDAVLRVHDIDLRHGHAGGDGHFLDDIEQFAFVGIGRVRVDEPAAHHFRNHAAALGQRHGFIAAADEDDRQRAGGHAQEQLRVPQRELRLPRRNRWSVRLDAGKNDERGEIDGDNEGRDGEREIKNKQLGFAAVLSCCAKKSIWGGAAFCRPKNQLGTAARRLLPALRKRNLRRVLLLRLVDDEQFRRAEVEHAGDEVAGENFAVGVVGHDRVVVGLPGEGDFIFRGGQFLGELHHVLVGLQVGIGFGNHHQPAEGAGQAGFGGDRDFSWRRHRRDWRRRPLRRHRRCCAPG